MSQPSAAEPRTFKEAEERLLVVLGLLDPPPADFAQAFYEEFRARWINLATANDQAVIDSAVIHNALRTATEDDDGNNPVLVSLFTPPVGSWWSAASARRIAHYIGRLPDYELMVVRDGVRALRRADLAPVMAMLDAALRTRMQETTDLKFVIDSRDLELSNVGGYIQQRLDRADDPIEVRDRIGEFLAETVLPSRKLAEKQKLRMQVDEMRRVRDMERNPTRQQDEYAGARSGFRYDMVKLLNSMHVREQNPELWEQNPELWDTTIAYLTVAELTGITNYALDSDLSDSFTRRLQLEVDRAQAERTDAEASGLIQRLALRDADAARELSTWLSRSVVLRQPQTHFRSHAQLAVAAFLAVPTGDDSSHKRKVQRAGGAGSSKKQRETDESKEQMEDDE